MRSVAVVGADGERDRQRAAVAGDAEELHEAEVAAELRVEVGRDRLGQAVPAGEVHQPALVDRLGHVDAEVAEPAGHVAAPPGATRRRGRPRRRVPSSSRTPVTTGVPSPSASGRRSPATPRRCGPRRRAGRSGRLRSTHSNVVRRTMITWRSSSPGCGSPRLAVIGIVDAAGGEQVVEHVGEAVAQRDLKRRARKPWVWCTCGAPRRSAANASSASAAAAAGRARAP